MPSQLLWDARPTAVTLIDTDGALKNLANNGLAVSAEYTNGTSLYTDADFLLYLHDFAAAPSANSFFAMYIVYELGNVYGDGEDGDLANPLETHMSGLQFVGNFPLKAADEDQSLQLMGVRLYPHDFKIVLVNKSGQAIANSNGSYLKIFPYCLESQ